MNELWSFIKVDMAQRSIEIDAPLLFAETIGAPITPEVAHYLVNSEYRCRELLAFKEKLEEVAQSFLYGKLSEESVLNFGMQCKRVALELMDQQWIVRWTPQDENNLLGMPFESMPWYVCPLCMDGDLRPVEGSSWHACITCEKRFAGPFFDKEGRYWAEPSDSWVKYPLILAAERG